MPVRIPPKGQRPSRTLGGTALGMIAFGAAFWGTRSMKCSHAEDAPRPVAAIRDTRVYELGELVDLVREETAVKLYADSRQRHRRLFVSKGTYRVPDLVAAVRVATGMSLRNVGETQFLTFADPTLGDRLLFPLLPETTLRQLGEALRPVAEKADLAKEGLPFNSCEFLARKRVPFAQMTPVQQDFVVNECAYRLAEGSMDSQEQLLHKARESLANANLRLGVSYLMAFAAYQPATSPGKADARSSLRVAQV